MTEDAESRRFAAARDAEIVAGVGTTQEYCGGVLEHSRPTRLTLEPLDDFVVVEYAEEEAETRAGLILPASLEAHCRSGIVIFVGPEVEGVAPGDKVLFPKDAGYDVRLAGTAQRVIKRNELIARILD